MHKIPQLLISAILFISIGCNKSPEGDFLIKNGTIIDGLGNPGFEGDILITDGKISVFPSGSGARAPKEIDASNLIIAPGFIDVHNHSDRSVRDSDLRLNECFIRQGVTTLVGGPDGGWAPSQLRKLIQLSDSVGIGPNIAFYVGHNGIRRQVMGEDQQRGPSSEELEQMKALTREGMEMGAVGLSTGLMYEPGMYSTTAEVIELAKEVEPFGGIYDSHVRNPVHAFVQSHAEVIEIATGAGIPGKLGHLKAVGLHNNGVIKDVISMVEKAREEGHSIISDQYPYDGAQVESLSEIIVIPSDLSEYETIVSFVREDQTAEAWELLRKMLRDPQTRSKIKKASEEGENGGFAWLKATGYTSMRVTSSTDYPQYVGKYLSEIAEETDKNPFDAVSELLINAKDSIFITLGGINERDVQELMVQPWNMIASDGLNVAESGASGGHPRSTGTFPRFLGHYVRDLGLLSLEEGIRKITSLPADIIGFPERGRIADGFPADLVIFDPNTIIDNSTYLTPNLYATGVIHVFVNGVPALLDEKMTGEAPGIFLSRNHNNN